tara:strand:+ start:394 stop:867 length:474 start_codon:yes stop_codon:yes gene_type:complete
VTLPAQLQAAYSGSAAGIRDFNTKGGLQYTTSDVSIDIDIDDFYTGAGVKGQVTNRKVFDLNGVDVTAEVAEEASTGAKTLPRAVFTVGPGVLAASGDVVGEITSTFTAADGSTTAYEAGNYYAVVSGANANKIVGVFVLEANSARETSGFIVYREP